MVRNDSEISSETIMKYSGVVISPGPEVPEKSGNLMNWFPYFVKSKPVLGICLGHQAIGQYFGSSILKAQKPMHGKISSISHNGDVLFDGVPRQFDAVRYNSLVISSSSELKTVAHCDSEIMAIRHRSLPVWGVQFHPEAALTKFGLKIISNWLEYNNIV